MHYPKENVQILAHCGLSRGRFYDSLNRTRSSDHVRQNKNVKCDVVVFCRRLINHLALSSTTTRKKKKEKKLSIGTIILLIDRVGQNEISSFFKNFGYREQMFFFKENDNIWDSDQLPLFINKRFALIDMFQ